MPASGALGSTFASSGTVCGAAMSNTQVAVRAELVNLSREDLMQRCIALQDQLADSGKAMVGQPQYFMTPEGYMLWQERTVRLTKDGGGLTEIPGVGTVIDALGWDRLNEVLRVHVYVNPNAQMIGNPARSVRVSGAAVGCVGGVPQVHTLSLTWAFYDMFLSELLQKVKRNKSIGAMGVRYEKPSGYTNLPINFYEIEGGAGIWVNLQHDDVITTLKTLQDRRSKPDRAAYTFLRRNLIRTFACGISQRAPKVPYDVVVRGWYYPVDKERLEKIALAAMKGEQADEHVQLHVVQDEVIQDANEGAAAEAELVDESTGEMVPSAGAVPIECEPAPIDLTPKYSEREKLIETVRARHKMLTREQKLELKKKFPQKADEMDIETLENVQAFIDEALNDGSDEFFGLK